MCSVFASVLPGFIFQFSFYFYLFMTALYIVNNPKHEVVNTFLFYYMKLLIYFYREMIILFYIHYMPLVARSSAESVDSDSIPLILLSIKILCKMQHAWITCAAFSWLKCKSLALNEHLHLDLRTPNTILIILRAFPGILVNCSCFALVGLATYVIRC